MPWGEPPSRVDGSIHIAESTERIGLIVARVARERVTIDLRGLSHAVEEHARARHLTVAAVIRLAVASALEANPLEDQPNDAWDAARDRSVKVTIRLRGGVSNRLSTQARACGLSHGAYVTTLIDEAPAPPRAVAAALAAPTEQVAVVSADVSELIRLVRTSGSPATVHVLNRMGMLGDDVRQHLKLASRLVFELRPKRIHPRQARRSPAESQAARQ